MASSMDHVFSIAPRKGLDWVHSKLLGARQLVICAGLWSAVGSWAAKEKRL